MDGSNDTQGRFVDVDDGSERTRRVRLYAATRGERDVILLDPVDEDEGRAPLRLVPRDDLSESGADRFRLAHPLNDYDRVDRSALWTDTEQQVVPILEESLAIERRPRTTARVQVRKWTEREPVSFDELLAREEVEVDRVLVDRPLHAGEEAKVRLDGDTLVIPVVEERLVVTKELVLREEVRVTRRRHQRRESGSVELRRVRVDVDRKRVDDERDRSGE